MKMVFVDRHKIVTICSFTSEFVTEERLRIVHELGEAIRGAVTIVRGRVLAIVEILESRKPCHIKLVAHRLELGAVKSSQ